MFFCRMSEIIWEGKVKFAGAGSPGRCLLFPGDTVFGAVFYGLVDVFIPVIIKGEHFHKTGIIDLKCCRCKFDAYFTENAFSQIDYRYLHGNPLFFI